MFQTPIPQPEVKPSQSFDPCLRQVLQVVQRPEYAEVAEEARPLQGFRSCSCGVWRCSDCGVSWRGSWNNYYEITRVLMRSRGGLTSGSASASPQ